MAFEIRDFNRHYTRKGDVQAYFNAARSDEDSSVEQYFAFLNEAKSHIIMQVTTSGTVTNKVYKYYASGFKADVNFDTDWSNRASLSYVDYYELFPGV